MVDPNSSAAGGGQFEVGLQGDGGYNQVLFARPAAGWHHYAFVLNKSAGAATEVTPYVDGKAVAYTKPSSAENTNAFGANPLYVMSRAGSSLFGAGSLDDIRISKRALSATEIASLAVTQTPPAITSSGTLPNGTVGTTYVKALTATGSTPMTWSIASGSLCSGMSLSPAGVVSGTPTTAGSYAFTVRASNGFPPDATQSVMVIVNPPSTPPSITTGSALPGGTVGTAYQVTLAASGTNPIAWSVTAGTLPSGLTLSASGALSGTPTTAGSYSFTVKATNGVAPDATKGVTLTIAPQATQPPAGGSAPYAYWKLDDGTGSTAADASGNGHAALFVNRPVWGTGARCAIGGCLLFNGLNQAGSAALDLTDTKVITVSFWLNWTSYSNNDSLAMEFTGNFNSATTGFMIDPNSSSGKFEAGLQGDGGYNQVVFARPASGLHHYTFVFDKSAPAATEVIPYVDGVAVAYTKPTSSQNTNNFGSDRLYFMSRGNNSLYGAGDMDDVRVYKRALSAAEVKGLAAKTLQ
jgi:hypothetical protein